MDQSSSDYVTQSLAGPQASDSQLQVGSDSVLIHQLEGLNQAETVEQHSNTGSPIVGLRTMQYENDPADLPAQVKKSLSVSMMCFLNGAHLFISFPVNYFLL